MEEARIALTARDVVVILDNMKATLLDT